jgi:hypothetical protein
MLGIMPYFSSVPLSRQKISQKLKKRFCLMFRRPMEVSFVSYRGIDSYRRTKISLFPIVILIVNEFCHANLSQDDCSLVTMAQES